MRLLLVGVFGLVPIASFAQVESLSFEQISSRAQALEFADQLVAAIDESRENGSKREVQFMHIHSERPNPYLITVIQILNSRGVKVSGSVLTRDQFEAEAKRIEGNAEEASQVIEGTQYEEVLRTLKPSGLRERIKLAADKLFGVPQGVTFWSVFKKKKWKIQRQSFLTDQAYQAALKDERKHISMGVKQGALAVVFMTAATALKGEVSLMRILAADAFIFAWVGGCLYLSKEIAKIRNQGSSVRLRFDPERGQYIDITRNQPTYVIASLVQSLTVNFLVLSILFAPELTKPLVLNGILNAFFSVYAKYPIQSFIDRIYHEADELDAQGDHENAEARRSLAFKLNNSWNYLYSFMKNIHLIAVGGFAAVPALNSWLEQNFGWQLSDALSAVLDQSANGLKTGVWWTFTMLGAIGLTKTLLNSNREFMIRNFPSFSYAINMIPEIGGAIWDKLRGRKPFVEGVRERSRDLRQWIRDYCRFSLQGLKPKSKTIIRR